MLILIGFLLFFIGSMVTIHGLLLYFIYQQEQQRLFRSFHNETTNSKQVNSSSIKVYNAKGKLLEDI